MKWCAIVFAFHHMASAMNSTACLLLEGQQRLDRLVVGLSVFLHAEVQHVHIRARRALVGGTKPRPELIAAAERDDLARAGDRLQIGPLRADGRTRALDGEIE